MKIVTMLGTIFQLNTNLYGTGKASRYIIERLYNEM